MTVLPLLNKKKNMILRVKTEQTIMAQIKTAATIGAAIDCALR